MVTDDDISGTCTFIRALEDSGRYAETPEAFFGETWLNYMFERQCILWWGGKGISTEHTAFLNLKNGIPSPESGSAARNSRIVAEQIGAQIFIDAFGMVAPGNPALAVALAEKAARVSHDGEAVYAAQVVAALVSLGFVERDIGRLLDKAVAFIPRDSLIAQIHRDVRAWAAADGDWRRTYDRIAAKYGYPLYGGGCHVVPNHAIMVMAWACSGNNFHRAMSIIATAGWDTDCNAANVGSVMGLVAGLVLRYQGTRRFYAVVLAGRTLQIRRYCHGMTVLAETAYETAPGQFLAMKAEAAGDRIAVSIDGVERLSAKDGALANGGAGYCVESGVCAFRETRVVAKTRSGL